MPDILRTPDERFATLSGYPFAPNYRDDLKGFEGLRLHFLDEGPRDAAKVFLCLHGHPTWSYLWRRMIPAFTAAGHRVVAPDFFGYGRSDKPVEAEVHSFDFHRGTVLALVDALDLSGITLVCHEWGGIVGLTVPMERPERFDGLLLTTTLLATGRPLPEAYRDWVRYCADNPDLNVRGIMARTNRILKMSECNAYGAPFPDLSYKAALRVLPGLVPDRSDAPGAEISRAAADWFASEWNGSGFMAIGQRDPLIGRRRMLELAGTIRNFPAPLGLEHAGHFVPEWGDEFAAEAVRSLAEQDDVRIAAAQADGDDGTADDGGGDG